MEKNKVKNNQKIVKKILNKNNKNLGKSLNKIVKQNGFKWAVIVLLLALILSVIVSAILIFNNQNFAKNNKQTLLVEKEILVTENSSNSTAIILANNIVLGVEYPQKVQLKNDGLINSQVVRVKAEVVCEDNSINRVNLKLNNRWLTGEDGYYYLNEPFTAETVVNLCEGIVLPEKVINKTDDYNGVIIFTVESLTESLNVAKTVWKSYPEGWLIY